MNPSTSSNTIDALAVRVVDTAVARAPRRELIQTLKLFRREFLLVGLISAVVNLLMLTPTLYMLQVYDRVLVSQNELTLTAVSLIALALYGLMAMGEWAR